MAAQESVQEFTVRIPKRDPTKNYQIMKFNESLRVDPAHWKQLRMVRENNKRDQKGVEEEMPKFGAGSEFGRDQREEARRRRFGQIIRKYDPNAQPWLMRVGNKKEGKHYRGIREGGISENTSYYVFTHAQDGSFEAHPVKDWYNFTPRVAYRTLNAEEAEEKFAERGKILNHFALMVNKKLHPDQTEGEDPDEDGKKGGGGSSGKKNLKISDMEEWLDEDDDDLDSDEGGSDGEKKTKKKKEAGRSKDTKKKKKKKDDADSEGIEDSDDGDGEGSEVDYMSDESSDSDDEVQVKIDQKGVDQDEGLSKMLDSDESEEEEERNEEEEDDEDDDKPKKKDDDKGKKTPSKNNSRAGTPTPDSPGTAASDEKSARAEKRKAIVDTLMDINEPSTSKRSRMETFGSASSSSSQQASAVEAAFEEDVRRYLARKPMTTTELLKKFKLKKTGLPKEELMPLLVNVIKRINPHKQKVKGTMYLSLKK